LKSRISNLNLLSRFPVGCQETKSVVDGIEKMKCRVEVSLRDKIG
jgi:hypothetical protein